VRRGRGERGAVTLAVIAFAGVFFLFVALVVDGGLALATSRQAETAAEEAARAAAQQLDQSALLGGTVRIDAAKATQAASRSLSGAKIDGTVTGPGVDTVGDLVTVTVTVRRALPLFGITVSHTATATARAARGVEREEG
jgi:Flp pilus assembly protein TadG